VTLGVDALTLSIVKLVRQLRRLFTHLIFQCGALGDGNTPELVKALEERPNVNVTCFITGIDALFRFSTSDMVGPRCSGTELRKIYKVRNCSMVS
jgi:hypothetical protein